MVSLGNESGRSASGGYFFGGIDSVGSNNSEELLIDSPSFVTEIEPQFRKIHTTWLIVLQIILVIMLEVVVFIDPIICHKSHCPTSGFEITVYTHAMLWFVLLIIDRCLNYLHNRSRMAGYLEFYRQTKCVRRLPFFLNSFGNVVLVVVTNVILLYCTNHETCGPLSSNNILQILISVEVAAMLISLIIHLVKTVKFNRNCAVPDVQRDEMATTFTHHHGESTEIGFKDDDYMEQVLEKQSDMIRYLKQHSAFLAKRVLTLTGQIHELTAAH